MHPNDMVLDLTEFPASQLRLAKLKAHAMATGQYIIVATQTGRIPCGAPDYRPY